MSHRSHKQHASGEEEGGGHSVGLWYVSFSDMITLLLAFFVMLCTFSSYDDESQKKFAGAVRYIYCYSVFPGKGSIRDSYLPPNNVLQEKTEGGSETPTQQDEGFLRNPRSKPWVEEDDVHRNRKVLYLASSAMFWGRGSQLTESGRRSLRLIADFLHQMPGQVTVGEVPPDPLSGGENTPESRLDRAWAIVHFLVAESGLPADRFNIKADAVATGIVTNRSPGESLVQIALLSGSLYR
jgi:hypothetical protein